MAVINANEMPGHKISVAVISQSDFFLDNGKFWLQSSSKERDQSKLKQIHPL
jgi:predicted transglutaminase-like cysteine proteinase